VNFDIGRLLAIDKGILSFCSAEDDDNRSGLEMKRRGGPGCLPPRRGTSRFEPSDYRVMVSAVSSRKKLVADAESSVPLK